MPLFDELSDSFLRLQWADDQPLDIPNDFSWTGYDLMGYHLRTMKSLYSHTGTFSKLVATFTLRREFGHFILDIYIPSVLFVISSWTSFWVEIPAAPARVTLGITTMLTLVTSAKTARDKLPRVSYIHALDIWIIMCTFFIFASLVEYATVNFIYHKEKRRSNKPKTNTKNNIQNSTGLKRTLSNMSFNSGVDSMYSSITSNGFLKPQSATPDMGLRRKSIVRTGSDGGIELIVPELKLDDISIPSTRPSIISNSKPNTCSPVFKAKPQDIANEIDRKCRLIFPISFLIINIIYW
ncbi:unnamed protein product, partial [Oppiella nova]